MTVIGDADPRTTVSSEWPAHAGRRRGDRIGYMAAGAPAHLRAIAIAFYELAMERDAAPDGASGWNRIVRTQPRVAGQAQPRLPLESGWYDPACPTTLARQWAVARRHGIEAFCFRVRTPSDLDVVALAALRNDPAPDGTLQQIRFCLHWSMESGSDDVEAEAIVFLDKARSLLSDRRCLHVDGRPLLLIEWNASLEPRVRMSIAALRAGCLATGMTTPFLVAVGAESDPRSSGFDAALAMPAPPTRDDENRQAWPAAKPEYRGRVCEYRELAERAIARAPVMYPEFRGVLCGWDDTPNRPDDSTICLNTTPDSYGAWLRATVSHAEAHPVAGERLVFIRAWNDWAHGATLEADDLHGYAWLHATRNALRVTASRPGIALMVHDAQAHGAQYLALHLLEEFDRLGVRVETLLQGGGALEPRFEALAPLHRLHLLSDGEREALADDLRARGVTAIIANTAVCGRHIAPFRRAGMRVVSLIHELPGIIAAYALQDALATLLKASDRVVVSARAVRDSLLALDADGDLARRLVMRPQGLYKRNRHAGDRNMIGARVRLRDRLGLPHHVAVAVAIGYANERKGVDLLARAAVRACAMREDLVVVWIGERDPVFCARVDALLRRESLQSRFRFVGFDYDSDDYFAGADVYALTSREDPLPSVVLESLSVGTPVVAFQGTGGGADLIEGRAGFSVPAFDVDAYAAAMLRVINDPALRETLGAAGRDLVERDFGFRQYALDLLSLAGDELPRISVVVPNRNYAHYLPERLDSIVRQTQPVSEIVVLDDASTDNSLEILQLQQAYVQPLPIVVRSSRGSGSVFRQWLAGVRRARGEFVWIAEADDLADPALIASLIAPMREDSRIVMAYAQSSRIDSADAIIASDYLGYTDDLDPSRWRASHTATGEEEVAAGLAVKNTIPNVSAALFRREPLLQVLERHIDELADYRIAGDWVVYLRLLKLGCVHFVPHALNRHRYHAASATARLDLQRHYDEVVAVQALAARLYRVDPRMRAAAEDYARRLKAHFGLASTECRTDEA